MEDLGEDSTSSCTSTLRSAPGIAFLLIGCFGPACKYLSAVGFGFCPVPCNPYKQPRLRQGRRSSSAQRKKLEVTHPPETWFAGHHQRAVYSSHASIRYQHSLSPVTSDNTYLVCLVQQQRKTTFARPRPSAIRRGFGFGSRPRVSSPPFPFRPTHSSLLKHGIHHGCPRATLYRGRACSAPGRRQGRQGTCFRFGVPDGLYPSGPRGTQRQDPAQ